MPVPPYRSRKIDFQSGLDRQASCPPTDRVAGAGLSNPRRSIDPLLRASCPANVFVLRGLFWLALFIILAFCFVVLFEYGPRNFANGFQKEFARVKSFVVKQTEKSEQP